MITLNKNEIDANYIPAYVFHSHLGCIVFKSLDHVKWRMQFSKGNQLLLDEDYVIDQNNEIRIYGLDDVVMASSNGMDDYTLELYVDDPSGSIGAGYTVEFVTVPCHLHLDMAANFFLDHYFLTPIQSKTTELGRKEQLSFVRLAPLPAKASILVTAEYWGDNARQTKTFDLGSVGRQSRSPECVDVSPDLFVVVGWQLVRYTVTLDNRSFVYTLGTAEESGFGFLFRNSFGCLDTLYCMGDVETDPEFERLHGRFAGQFVVYHAQETYKRIAHSGQIPTDMVALWDDLVRSTEVYTIDDGREVTITDNDSGRTDNLNDYPSGSVTFRPSSRYAPLDLGISMRIFDETFDKTFN